MLKPALIVVTGAATTAAAHFSGARPSLLAMTQLIACFAVYAFKSVPESTTQIEHFHGFVSVGAFLFLSKFFEYWTMALAGPLTSQVAFLSMPIALYVFSRTFPYAHEPAEMDRPEIAMQMLFLAAIPILALTRDIPNGWGILTALATLATTSFYVAFYSVLIKVHSDKPVIGVRASVYLAASIFAGIVDLYSLSRPTSLPFYALFALSAASHAVARKWYDATDGSRATRPAGEWNSLRSLLALTWAWYLYRERSGALIFYGVAIAFHAFFFYRGRIKAKGARADQADLDGVLGSHAALERTIELVDIDE